MIHSIEKINFSGNKLADVFIYKTDDQRVVVAIPEIHWSAILTEGDCQNDQFEHVENSLNFHLFQGDTKILTKAIVALVTK